MKKLVGIVCVLQLLAFHSSGQWFQPTFRITTTAVYPNNDLKIGSGIFDVHTRRVNLGFEFTNEFRLHKKLLVETGIRYTPVKTTVSGLNQIDVRFAKPDPFTWTRKFTCLTVPVLFTKYFKSKNNRVGKYFVGFSVGVFENSYEMVRSSGGVRIDPNNNDSIAAQSFGTDLERTQFYGTLDAGIKFHPFKKSKNLELGLLISYQLNKNKIGDFQGTENNVSKNQVFSYNSALYQRFTNVSVSVGHKFGTNKKKRKNKNECPTF